MVNKNLIVKAITLAAPVSLLAFLIVFSNQVAPVSAVSVVVCPSGSPEITIPGNSTTGVSYTVPTAGQYHIEIYSPEGLTDAQYKSDYTVSNWPDPAIATTNGSALLMTKGPVQLGEASQQVFGAPYPPVNGNFLRVTNGIYYFTSQRFIAPYNQNSLQAANAARGVGTTMQLDATAYTFIVNGSFPKPGIPLGEGNQSFNTGAEHVRICQVGQTQTQPTIACSTNAQCGTNAFTGSLTCNGNSIFQNYQTFTCVNPGLTSSYCAPAVTTSQFVSNCGYNQTCQNGACINQVINTCTPNSYQQCLNGSVHWFNSCGADMGISQACNGNQTCSGNVCVNNYINNNYNNNNYCTPNSYQQCLNSSVHWFNSCGVDQGVSQYCNNGCSGNTCNNNNQYQNQNASLTVTETVRNLSSGNLNYFNSVSASPGDVLQFDIAVTATGNTMVNNVSVRDTLPANLIYNNNLTLDGQPIGGTITSGVNIGSVSPGQTRNVTYQAQVAGAQNFSFGTTTLTDATYVSSTDNGVNPATASAQAQVTRGGVLGATTVSTGLTNNVLFDSFFIPLVVALMGVWLVKSGYIGMPVWATKVKLKNKEATAKKQLATTIAKIKTQEAVS